MALPHIVTSLATVALPSHTAMTALTATTSILSSTASTLAVIPSSLPSLSPVFSGTPDGENPDSNGECQLLGPFSLLVQAALGALALLSLVYKRWKERPQRPLKIWSFDVSKQVFGSAMLHLANLLMSMFSAGQFEIRKEYQPNPCSFYLLNLGIDTTLGIPILVVTLRIINHLALYTPLANPPESIESGNYGNPPSAAWWFKQSLLYFISLLWMKICVFFVIQMLPFIVKVGDWALRWTEGNTAIQIIFVMLLFPVIMNAIQYYIIDTFIKKQIPVDHNSPDEVHDGMLDDDPHHRSALLAAISDDEESDLDDNSIVKSVEFRSQPKATATRPHSVEKKSVELDSEDVSWVPSSSSSATLGRRRDDDSSS